MRDLFLGASRSQGCEEQRAILTAVTGYVEGLQILANKGQLAENMLGRDGQGHDFFGYMESTVTHCNHSQLGKTAKNLHRRIAHLKGTARMQARASGITLAL